MQSTETYSYQNTRQTAKIGWIEKIFKGKEIAIYLIAFMMGRVVIFSQMSPFGMAFYASTLSIGLGGPITAAAMILGIVTANMGWYTFKYVAATCILTLLYMIKPTKISIGKIGLAGMASVSLMTVGIVLVITQGFLLYDLFVLLFEALIAFVMVFIFRNSVPIICQRKQRKVLSNEEVISLSILMALVMTGFGNMTLMGIVSIRSMLCITILLILGVTSGAAITASAGITIGLINSVTSPMMPLLVGSYAFCGLITGVFKPFGKAGVSLGFILANAIFTIYVNGSTEVLIHIYDILAATLIFIFIPSKGLAYIKTFLDKNTEKFVDRRGYSDKMQHITVDKLRHISESFKQLACTFDSIAQKKKPMQNTDVTAFFDQIADRVCRDCSLCLCCWEREFHNTYQVMFKMLETLESKDRIQNVDVPTAFERRCLRIDEFVREMNNMFEIYKVNLLWHNKVGESRGLVSQQLYGVSQIISSLAKEISVDLNFDEQIERKITVDMDKVGIAVKDVTVMKNANGKYEITIDFRSCGGTRKCVKSVADVISHTVGRKMVKESSSCVAGGTRGRCVIKYIEQEKYQVSVGVTRARKQGQQHCGDNYAFMQLRDGKYILALSDGMGSGTRAARESSATIALLEQFLESGFDKNTAVKLINSVLVLKSPDESFATIDLSAVDLYTGSVEFAKIGAATTFIKKKQKVEVIKSTSLPIGILDNIDIEISSKTVSDGDFIVMMTDGVLDSRSDMLQKEQWVKEELMAQKTTNPQEIADALLQKAVVHYDNDDDDDMTVLVAKVWEKCNQHV